MTPKNGKPQGAANETQHAIMKALTRIELLEKQDLTARIAMNGPDEIFAMNETQKQIDLLVSRANDTQGRTLALENLIGGIVQQEDEKNTLKLKGMTSNLKSKFSFLDPNSDTVHSESLPSQVVLLEEKFSSLQKLVMAHEQE